MDFLKESPVELTFKHLEFPNRRAVPVCSFWKYDPVSHESGGTWSSDGCATLVTNQTHTTCQCTHLTHFAILMDMHEVSKDLTDVHRTILTVITIVCSIVSCVCIVFTLIAFRFIKVIKKNRKQSTTKDLTIITTHLCACLLASLFAFLVGILIQHLQIKVLLIQNLRDNIFMKCNLNQKKMRITQVRDRGQIHRGVRFYA